MKIYKITEASEYLGVSINTLKTLANNAAWHAEGASTRAPNRPTRSILGFVDMEVHQMWVGMEPRTDRLWVYEENNS